MVCARKINEMSFRLQHFDPQSSVDIITEMYRTAPKFPNSSRLLFKDMFVAAREVSSVSISVLDSRYVALFDVKQFDPEQHLEAQEEGLAAFSVNNLYRFRLFKSGESQVDRLVFTFEAYQDAESGDLFIEKFKKDKDWLISENHLKEFFRMTFDDIAHIKMLGEMRLDIEEKNRYRLETVYFVEHIKTLDYDEVDEKPDNERRLIDKGKLWTVYHFSNK